MTQEHLPTALSRPLDEDEAVEAWLYARSQAHFAEARPAASEDLPIEPVRWPDQYVHRKEGHVFTLAAVGDPERRAQLERERAPFYEDTPEIILLRGGEGSGKSALACIKDLERIRRGCDGFLISPDHPHFARSLWEEFRNWCPPQVVIPRQRHMLEPDWDTSGYFPLHFVSELGTLVTVHCGGAPEPMKWEGMNANWCHADEARRWREPDILKMIAGRVRRVGPRGEPPQAWLSTTPMKNAPKGSKSEWHWLYHYFGDAEVWRCENAPRPEDETQTFVCPWEGMRPSNDRCPLCGGEALWAVTPEDPLRDFKENARVFVLLTKDNETNVEGFATKRGRALTEEEKYVLLEGGWASTEEATPFLPTISLWDACYDEHLPPLSRANRLVVALDAGVSNDSFGLVGVSRHPRKRDSFALQIAKEWKPQRDGRMVNGQMVLDFDEIEKWIRQNILRRFTVLQMTGDPSQLHQMLTRFEKILPTEKFDQGATREAADKHLFDLITQNKIFHRADNPEVRAHLYNSDRRLTGRDGELMRIVKRSDALKIDCAVSLSMAAYAATKLPVEPMGSLQMGGASGWGL